MNDTNRMVVNACGTKYEKKMPLDTSTCHNDGLKVISEFHTTSRLGPCNTSAN
jgi:hypothetical protein